MFSPNNNVINSFIMMYRLNQFYYCFAPIITQRVMYPDLGDKKQHDKIFKQMYQSSLKASYFNHMAENKYTNQSKLQIQQINEEEEEVDQNTFRVMTGFVKPDDTFIVYHKTGKVYLEQEGFFSCLASRKRYDIQIKNSNLIVSRSETEIAQFFNFDTEEIEVVSKGSYFILRVSHCQQKFYFEPVEQKSKANIVDDWVNLINKVIGVTLGKQKHYVYLPIKDKKFYQQPHVSHQQFEKSCNSLDLILLKSQHSAARIQRLFTDSEYDHVGVVLRNRKNEIFIYESTSGEGVGLTPWKHMIKFEWYNSTDKIAWRRLNIKLTNKDVETIEAFVAKTLGKEFEITLQKMFVFSSALKRSNEEQQKKTYFCSELVARLYKELLLLDPERSSTRYYPVDFSQKTKLPFKREGTYLQPERVLAFNQ